MARPASALRGLHPGVRLDGLRPRAQRSIPGCSRRLWHPSKQRHQLRGRCSVKSTKATILSIEAFTFDLRLLGVGHRAVSVTAAARTLLRIAHIGFAIALLTGIALLSAQAVVVADTGAAPWKFGLLILALLNVLVFHGGIYRHIYEWADAAVPPVAVRVGACVSLLSWTGVIFSGRLLAYT